jgi:hypothetical protein
MADGPFVGPTYPRASKPASVQRTINQCPVPLEPGNERAGWVFVDTPGLRTVSAPPAPVPPPPSPPPPSPPPPSPGPPPPPAPPECYDEPWGVSSFQHASGLLDRFVDVSTPYGPGLGVLSQANISVSKLRKLITQLAVQTLDIKFRIVLASSADDAPIFEAKLNGVSRIAFNPRRELAVYGVALPVLTITYDSIAEGYALGSSALTVNVWYQLHLEVISDFQIAASITNLDTSTVVAGPITYGLVTGPIELNSIEFWADSGNTTSAATYTDLHICPPGAEDD